ncbi:MAG: hypothetical protein V4857_27040 [Pseudomonadota bacterium]
MHIAITCKTDRFNLSVVGEDFINDCCFGEDFSSWLVAALTEAGVDADVICMEDFGWANQASYKGVSYLICVGGSPDEQPDRPNYGEWHLVVERHRTLLEKLTGKNKTAVTDPIFEPILKVLRAAGFEDVGFET